MEERREKGPCFGFNNKLSKGHKCQETKLITLENNDEEEMEASIEMDEEELVNLKEQEKYVEIMHNNDMCEIYVHAFAGLSTPQTLKIVGYIKKQKVTILIDLGRTHNFIDKRLAESLNCFVYPMINFPVLVANGGSIDYVGKCHNIKLTMREYNLQIPMYVIPIGGVDVVFGIEWLRKLGTISTNYNELFMILELEGSQHELKGLKIGPSQVINSHRMEKILKEGSRVVVVGLYSMEVKQEDENIPEELKWTLEKHHKVFQEIPNGIPSSRDHEHQIELIHGSTPPNKMPYRYPHQQKREIEKMVQDMLDSGIIQQSSSSFSTPVVMVRKKYNAWRMCPDYRDLNKITIKDKFPIPNFDKLLDELHGVACFTTLDLKLGYHQIKS
jgi:hypothetical protein